jgi:D-alanine transaminase/branched-chain amino acid aminotransferase
MAIWLQPWLKSQGGDEILYYNQDTITECPRSNIFMVSQENKLITPKSQMLGGITRKKIIDLAASINMEVEERNIQLQELNGAKEVFITSSTKRILPVSRLDNKYQYEVSTFEFTKQLWDAFLKLENNNSSF